MGVRTCVQLGSHHFASVSLQLGWRRGICLDSLSFTESLHDIHEVGISSFIGKGIATFQSVTLRVLVLPPQDVSGNYPPMAGPLAARPQT